MDGRAVGVVLINLVIVSIVCISVLRLATPTLNVINLQQIGNTASVKTVGVQVNVTSIDWGILEPNETAYHAIEVVNVSNIPIVLSLTTESWVPSNASDYMTLNWNYNGAALQVDAALETILSLHVHPNVSGITDFSFTITISGTG